MQQRAGGASGGILGGSRRTGGDTPPTDPSNRDFHARETQLEERTAAQLDTGVAGSSDPLATPIKLAAPVYPPPPPPSPLPTTLDWSGVAPALPASHNNGGAGRWANVVGEGGGEEISRRLGESYLKTVARVFWAMKVAFLDSQDARVELMRRRFQAGSHTKDGPLDPAKLFPPAALAECRDSTERFRLISFEVFRDAVRTRAKLSTGLISDDELRFLSPRTHRLPQCPRCRHPHPHFVTSPFESGTTCSRSN